MKKYLALDVSDKRIGVALGVQGVCVPVVTYQRRALAQDLLFLAEKIQEEHIACVVMGQPINMDGSVGPTAMKVAQFFEQLREFLQQKGLQVELVLWDERLSTFAAKAAVGHVKKQKGAVDSMAAKLILEDYLLHGLKK
ncbi:MAG: Holliday junction resolvase RuvX [Deltaproteobacteria bacterium]|nr:Holliday junction resolvase RuvX [Deltaproteobacteria bacterium]